MSKRVFHASCACGQVEFEGRGAPLATLSCYCDDCQAAGKYVDALPGGHSGMREDGGTVSVLFRKDRVACTRGKELIVLHKLRPNSHTARSIASCCNSNLSTGFDNWFPMAALRTFSSDAPSVRPEMCINTRFAPDASKLIHDVPRTARVPVGFLLKLMAATLELALLRLPISESRLY